MAAAASSWSRAFPRSPEERAHSLRRPEEARRPIKRKRLGAIDGRAAPPSSLQMNEGARQISRPAARERAPSSPGKTSSTGVFKQAIFSARRRERACTARLAPRAPSRRGCAREGKRARPLLNVFAAPLLRSTTRVCARALTRTMTPRGLRKSEAKE